MSTPERPGTVPDPIDRRRPHHLRRRIAIIGAGPGAVIAAVRLSQAGYDDVELFERDVGIGGTWLRNRYPGCACDVQAPLYSFSFAPNPDWSHPFAPQPEILAYVQDVADRHGVGERCRFRAEVTALRWREETAEWHIELGDGDVAVADVVISAVGTFGRPSIPELPGLDDFAGPVWHSAEWPDGESLVDRSVAVFGSGATAIQVVPAIADDVAAVTMFVRSPQWVLPRDEEPYSDADRAAFRGEPETLAQRRSEVYERMEQLLSYTPDVIAQAEAAARAHLETVVDPTTRAALTPDVPWGCMRPVLSNRFYPTVNREHVSIVRSSIATVVPDGVRTVDGRLHHADAIVFCTGFDTTRYLASVDVVGRGGRRLADEWGDAPSAYLGMRNPGFPNLFQLYGPNTNAGSVFFMIECQVDHLVRHLQAMDEADAAWSDISARAAEEFDRWLRAALDGVPVWRAGCSNYYRAPSGRIVTQWPRSMTEYRARTAVDHLEHYEFGARPAVPASHGTSHT